MNAAVATKSREEIARAAAIGLPLAHTSFARMRTVYVGRVRRQYPVRGAGEQDPNTKLQASKKHQAPSSKTEMRAVRPCIRFWGLVFRDLELLWSLGFVAWYFARRSVMRMSRNRQMGFWPRVGFAGVSTPEESRMSKERPSTRHDLCSHS